MSIDIYVQTSHAKPFEAGINMANGNAAELFEWVGITAGLWDAEPMRADELAPLCRRRLWDVERNHDPARSETQYGRVITCARPAGYLRQRTEELLQACETALKLDKHALIYWG